MQSSTLSLKKTFQEQPMVTENPQVAEALAQVSEMSDALTKLAAETATGPVLYRTSRYGRTKEVYLIELRKDEVLLKESLDRKDSFTIPLAKFIKFYQKVA